MGYKLDFVVDLVEERVDQGGSQFSESILERLFSAYAYQQIATVLDLGVQVRLVHHHWLTTQIVMINNGSPCSLTKCLISNVERSTFMSRTCLRTTWHIFCFCFSDESPRSLMCLFNVGLLTSRCTCLDYTRQNEGSPHSLWRTRFFVKRIHIDLLRTGRFSFTVLASSLTTGLPILSLPDSELKLQDSCPTSYRWLCSESNSLFHSCFKDIFGGSRGDMYAFSYKTSPVFSLTTFEIQ